MSPAARMVALLVAVAAAVPATAAATTPAPELEVFVRPGCPHCEAAEAFLVELERERPGLHVVIHDVTRDTAARARLERLSAEHGVRAPGVPSFLVGDELLVGFTSAETTGRRLRALLDGEAGEAGRERVHSNLFGELSVSRLGLPLFTVAVGLLDGLNPCAMWILLFLLSMLINLRDRSRMTAIAGTFVLVSGAVYYAFMAAWLNLFLIIGFSRGLQLVLGLVALAVGALNVKDFFAFRRGPSLGIPERAKPGIYARVRAILRERELAASLAGVAALATLVSAVELLCTAGLPALYTAVLAGQGLSGWERHGYLVLYNLAYIADDAVMVTVAVLTLRKTKLTERGGRWLKLVSGAVMLALALALLLFPEWL